MLSCNHRKRRRNVLHSAARVIMSSRLLTRRYPLIHTLRFPRFLSVSCTSRITLVVQLNVNLHYKSTKRCDMALPKWDVYREGLSDSMYRLLRSPVFSNIRPVPAGKTRKQRASHQYTNRWLHYQWPCRQPHVNDVRSVESNSLP